MGRNSDTARRQKGEKKMPEIKLKPCPFCGGEAYTEIVAAHNHIFVDMPDCDGEAFVFCNDCSAAVSGRNEQEAAEAWNRREGK